MNLITVDLIKIHDEVNGFVAILQNTFVENGFFKASGHMHPTSDVEAIYRESCFGYLREPAEQAGGAAEAFHLMTSLKQPDHAANENAAGPAPGC